MTLTIGILMTGVAVIKAAEYIQDSWKRKIEIARIETEVKLKRAHLDSINEMLSRAKERFSNGLIREDEYQVIKLAAVRAEMDVSKSQLSLEEVKESGHAPRNELYAPLVGGRDFVSERLLIEMKEIGLDIDQYMTHFERLYERAERDLVSSAELGPLQAEINTREMMIAKIQTKLALRARFVKGEISAQEVEIEGRIVAAERNLNLAKTRVDTLEKQLQRLKDLEARNMVTQTEVRQMEYALNAAQAELELAALELNVLEKVK